MPADTAPCPHFLGARDFADNGALVGVCVCDSAGVFSKLEAKAFKKTKQPVLYQAVPSFACQQQLRRCKRDRHLFAGSVWFGFRSRRFARPSIADRDTLPGSRSPVHRFGRME